MTRVLITGAAGLIGRTACRHFAEAGYAVTALVLDDPGGLSADRVVVGDAADRDTVAAALDGADAVVHLAAIPAPELGSPDAVFAGNTAATFAVLDAAGERGVRNAVIASSINALGYRYGPRQPAHPEYVPLDERLPSVAADPYSLSKLVDELTAQAMHRRHGMDVVALRFPMVGGLGDDAVADDRLLGYLDKIAADPGHAAPDLWLYLETRDAARAAELALRPSRPGAHTVFVAAPENSTPYPTEQLLAAFHPDVPRRRAFAGREAPVDLAAARELIGFTATRLAGLPERPLPG
ncbi:NAD-dependent epimerase/dehydratase family protein [Jiangella rhizosphaerae]|uniref:NAD(P)-dependent oxidoreductase n=1 Tax=Jiangella rhizosphaerae TaxID=2293569 RepID=A0A418KIU2_9ACTN|nr:NAD(P)-dependent oxidoreductase [Jiangella rhizosphaerae]RIQ13252.1 NAD(P)-dependent oxidoreductase [Jiangella rhizosphaerae]